jgi:hypothetical protein
MNQQLILQPLVSLFILTGIVWTVMYVRRLSYMFTNKIDPQSVSTPELMGASLPAHINNASNNLKNLFEMPVVFYAVCAILLMTQRVDTLFLNAAWTYVGLRALHSLIHCTLNTVKFRFTAYFLSSLVLWFMVARLAMAVFN